MMNCSLRAGPDEIMLPQNEMYSQSLKPLPTVSVVNTIRIYLKGSFTHLPNLYDFFYKMEDI